MDDSPYHIAEPRYGSSDHDDHRPIERAESRFRHNGWHVKRQAIVDALRRTGERGRRILNFCDCGSDLWVHRDGSELALSCNRCHDRLCDPCQTERRAAVVEQVILRMIDSPDDCRFATLTLKHRDVPLSDQIDRLLSSFKLLRQHKSMAGLMVGGVWFLEVKLDKQGRLWHPHLHVIVAGSRIDQKLLARTWNLVTGDSFMVDIRAIPDKRQRAAYVAKYSTKPLHKSVTALPDKLDEFVTAIKGRRLMQCFGKWSDAQRKIPPAKRNLARVGALVAIHADALAGDVQSLVVMHQLFAKWPKLRQSHPLPDNLALPSPPHSAASDDSPDH